MKSILTIVYFIFLIILLIMIISQCSQQDRVEVVWPEYDHTKPYNPFSNKNPNDSVTVGDPTYADVIVRSPVNPTPFTGMYD
jgi:hypothetical protein